MSFPLINSNNNQKDKHNPNIKVNWAQLIKKPGLATNFGFKQLALFSQLLD